MRVIVLGGGLLGVASAYYLQQLGHKVTVVDRHGTPAAKARGLVSPSTPADLPARVAPRRGAAAWKTLVTRVQGHFTGLAGYLSGATQRPAERLEHLTRLGAYSRETVQALRQEAGVSQGARTSGWLQFYTDPKSFEAFARRVPRLHSLGCALKVISTEEAGQIEPALRSLRGQLAGAAFAQEDTTRDPAPFAASLVFMCRAAGVRFMTNHTVTGLHAHDGRIDRVDLADRTGELSQLRADSYVLALGTGTGALASGLGIDLPMQFVREYTLMLPVKDPARAPRVMLSDRCGRLRIQRVETPEGDDWLRVGSSAPANGDASDLPDPERFAEMLRRVEALLPAVVDTAGARFSSIVQVRHASGLPVIGRTALRNLFLNTAPGVPGWVNACGAGKSIARIVSGLAPEVEFAFAKG